MSVISVLSDQEKVRCDILIHSNSYWTSQCTLCIYAIVMIIGGWAGFGQAAMCQAQSHLWDVFRKQNYYTPVVNSLIYPDSECCIIWNFLQHVKYTHDAVTRCFDL